MENVENDLDAAELEKLGLKKISAFVKESGRSKGKIGNARRQARHREKIEKEQQSQSDELQKSKNEIVRLNQFIKNQSKNIRIGQQVQNLKGWRRWLAQFLLFRRS